MPIINSHSVGAIKSVRSVDLLDDTYLEIFLTDSSYFYLTPDELEEIVRQWAIISDSDIAFPILDAPEAVES